MKSTNHQISILGSSFSIKTDEDPEYFRTLISYVEHKIAELEKNTGLKEPLRLSILSSIILTDELFKLQKRKSVNLTQEESTEAEKLTLNSIRLLEKYLEME